MQPILSVKIPRIDKLCWISPRKIKGRIVSGEPHHDRGSEQPESELDPKQPVPGISAPQGWALDDEQDATIHLPPVSAPVSQGTSPDDADGDATRSWESLMLGGRDGDDVDEDATVVGLDPVPMDDDATQSIDALLTPAGAPAPEASGDEEFDAAAQTDAAPQAPETTDSAEASGIESQEIPAATPAAQDPNARTNAEGLPLRPRNHGRRSAKPAKKSHTLLWAILAGVLVVLIAVALILYFTLRNNQEKISGGSTVDSIPSAVQKGSPAAAVRDLGKAMKSGDADAALDLLDVSSLGGGNGANPLLTNKVYHAASNRPDALTPAKSSYGIPASDALSAGVTATLTQGGKDKEISVRLTRDDADSPWKVATASLPAVDVTDGGAAKAKVNGVNVTLPGTADDYSTHRLFVLPGNYTLQRTNSKFVSYPAKKSFNVSGEALASDAASATTDLGVVSLEGKLNGAFKKEATKSVNQWLDACIASTELAPKNCPFGADADGKTVTDIKWKLDKEPTISFPDLSVGNAQAQGKDGQASVSAKVKQNGDDATLEAEMNVEFNGTLKVSGNKVTFTYAG
jgi:hypothetical protein